jgi:hypothetical protein
MAIIKKNHFLTGFISGLLAPFIGFYIYYLISFRYMSLQSYVSRLVELGLEAGVLSLSLIANLIVFFYFIKGKADSSARGVIGATFLYGMLIVIIKYTR